MNPLRQWANLLGPVTPHTPAGEAALPEVRQPPRARLIETLADWDAGRWVHYSQHAMLTIHPKPFHQDPLGIYAFPEAFPPYTNLWLNMPYKFLITLKPGVRILDLATVSNAELDALLAATGGLAEFSELAQQYPIKDHADRVRRVWQSMRSAMILRRGAGGRARWNKILRQHGWDAIFDDTKSIHSAEVQLLILDPRAISQIEQQRQGGSGFAAMQRVVADLRSLCAGYGTVTVEGPRKTYDGSFHYKGSPKILMADIAVKASATNHATLRVRYDVTDKTYKGQITINLRWSQPSLGYGVGAVYDLHKQRYASAGSRDDLEQLRRDLDRVFAGSDAAAASTAALAPAA